MKSRASSAFAADTLRRNYAFKIKCGWQPSDAAVPRKPTQVVTGTGKIDPESTRQRVELYWKEVGVPL